MLSRLLCHPVCVCRAPGVVNFLPHPLYLAHEQTRHDEQAAGELASTGRLWERSRAQVAFFAAGSIRHGRSFKVLRVRRSHGCGLGLLPGRCRHARGLGQSVELAEYILCYGGCGRIDSAVLSIRFRLRVCVHDSFLGLPGACSRPTTTPQPTLAAPEVPAPSRSARINKCVLPTATPCCHTERSRHPRSRVTSRNERCQEWVCSKSLDGYDARARAASVPAPCYAFDTRRTTCI